MAAAGEVLLGAFCNAAADPFPKRANGGRRFRRRPDFCFVPCSSASKRQNPAWLIDA